MTDVGDESVRNRPSEDGGRLSVDGLIARLEAATEGSQELDDAIAAAGFAYPVVIGIELSRSGYTRSIDAALSLVPEGWFWRVGHTSSFKAWAIVHQTHPDHGERDRNEILFKREPWEADSTPALALCIAALRARRTSPLTGPVSDRTQKDLGKDRC